MKIAIYARVSTERQEKQETIKSQLEALREFARNEGHAVVDEYIDEGYSGDLLDRPALDKLRDNAKQSLFEAVLVHSPDRLARRYMYMQIIQDDLAKRNIKLIFLNRPDSKGTPEDMLLEGMQGLIAEYEKTKIVERTRRGKLHKIAQNQIIGSKAPYGYTYVRGDRFKNKPGYYEVKTKEARVVQLIFDLVARKGFSVRGIAKELTRRGIAPREGIHWRTSTLHRMLRNETYIGTTYYYKHSSFEQDGKSSQNKYRRIRKSGRRLRPKQEWKAIQLPESCRIIDQDTFELAQSQLKRNGSLSPRNAKNPYLLQGLVRCGKCGSIYRGLKCQGILYYRCDKREAAFPKIAKCEQTTWIRAEDLETTVWDTFCRAIRHPRIVSDQVDTFQKTYFSGSRLAEEISTIQKEIEATDLEEPRLLDAYRERIITLEQLKDQLDKIKSKKTLLESEISVLLKKKDRGKSLAGSKMTVKDYCKIIAGRLNDVEGDFDRKRHLIRLAINSVVIDGKKVRIKGIIPAHTPTPDDTLPEADNITFPTPSSSARMKRTSAGRWAYRGTSPI